MTRTTGSDTASAGRAALIMLSLIGCALPARASDYSNECKSADNRYVIEDGALFRTSDTARKTRLTFSVIEERVLEIQQGYCVSNNPDAKGRRYGNFFRKTSQKVMIDEADGKRETTVLCELASSGLPAAYTCNQEVKTRSETRPGPVQSYRLGTPGTWTHNGSVMKLEAEGAERRLIYKNPRDGIRRVGISADTTLFEGRREGNRYVGSARYFSQTCGEQSFPVSGTVSADESRIELEGEAPRLDTACKRVGVIAERLVFERVK